MLRKKMSKARIILALLSTFWGGSYVEAREPGQAAPASPLDSEKESRAVSRTAQTAGDASSKPAPPDPKAIPWKATRLEYEAATTVKKRLTPNGPVDAPQIEGWRSHMDIVHSAYGTYGIAVPSSWLYWTLALPPDPFIEKIREVDPKWAAILGPGLRAARSGHVGGARGLYFSAKDLAFVQVSFLGRFTLASIEGWQKDPKTFRNKAFWDTIERYEWVENPSGKVLKQVNFSPDRSQVNIIYTAAEMANGTMWTVNCFTPAELLTANETLCDKIISTFYAGAYIEENRSVSK
jgi:hypothetical protein